MPSNESYVDVQIGELTTQNVTADTDTQLDVSAYVPPRNEWPTGTHAIRFGGDYNPEQWSRDVWLEDIRLMREAGVNLVSVGIFSWALLEPREGEFEFGFLDEIMDLLADAGIDVDLATPTAAPPAWFYAAYPQSRVVTRDGVTLGGGSRGMVSPSSPDYRRAAARITEELAKRYAGHPALAMWHVHNEYGAPVAESYSDESVAAFRVWLERKYLTLDALNSAWGTAFWGQGYGDWQHIDAPRQSASVVNQTQRLDFARFTSDALLECFCLERDVIRRYTPQLAVTTNFMASSCGALEYWSWSKEVDLVANDHYLTAARSDSHVLLALDADLTRSLAGGRPWMLMEHSTSAVNWQPRNVAKQPGELARNSLSHLARGADGILFFQFRASRFGAEKFHSAMLPHAGVGSRIWQEVLQLGETLRAVGDVRGARVDARVAIVWDVESFWAHDLEWRPSVDLDHRERIVAYYAALWRRGVTVDFVHPHADLSGYNLVVAPSLYLVDQFSAANIRSFVAAGGTFVVSYFSGIVDENDTVYEGAYPGALREILGVSAQEFLPFRDGETASLDGFDGATHEATASIWADDLELSGAESVLRFSSGRAEGIAAVTRNRFGSGTAWYVATSPDAVTLDQILQRALSDSGIESELLPEGIESVTRSSDTGSFRFYINHSPADALIRAHGRELLTSMDVAGELVVPAGALRVVHSDD